MNKAEIYKRKVEIQKELNVLYSEELLWRTLSHNGSRDKTQRRSGKKQRKRNSILHKINSLKSERQSLNLALNGFDIEIGERYE